MTMRCGQQDCTVVETGSCLLNNEPSTCPERVADSVAGAPGPIGNGAAALRFPASQPYGLKEVRDMMEDRYVRLVGILGEPNAGKTACLASLYLLLARNQLEGFSFADSRTLMGLEQISQGARRWNSGQLPEQLTAHTKLTDDRSAGFLHLRILPEGMEPCDLLFSDLPGEWTSHLIDSNRADRLAFLRQADAIWLVIDGQALAGAETRNAAIHRTRLLIQRLATFLTSVPPVFLVITRTDLCLPSKESLRELLSEVPDLSIQIETVSIASFSAGPDVAPGSGISKLIATTIKLRARDYPLWPEQTDDKPFLARGNSTSDQRGVS